MDSPEPKPEIDEAATKYLQAAVQLRVATGKQPDIVDQLHEEHTRRLGWPTKETTFAKGAIRLGDIYVRSLAISADIPGGPLRDLMVRDNMTRRLEWWSRKPRIDAYRQLIRAGAVVPILLTKGDHGYSLADGVYRLLALCLEHGVDAAPTSAVFVERARKRRESRPRQNMVPSFNQRAHERAKRIWDSACSDTPRVTLGTKRRILLSRLGRHYFLNNPNQTAFHEDLEFTPLGQLAIWAHQQLIGKNVVQWKETLSGYPDLALQLDKLGIPSIEYFVEMIACFFAEVKAIDKRFEWGFTDDDPIRDSDPLDTFISEPFEAIDMFDKIHHSQEQDELLLVLGTLERYLKREQRSHPLRFSRLFRVAIDSLEKEAARYEKSVCKELGISTTKPVDPITDRERSLVEAYFEHYVNKVPVSRLTSKVVRPVARGRADEADTRTQLSALRKALFPVTPRRNFPD